MSTTVNISPALSVRSKLADYLELTKPRIAALVLIVEVIAGVSARWGLVEPLLLLHAVIGTIFISSSASALNHWLERKTDSLMPRTADRPLATGRLSSTEVLVLATLAFLAGVCYLAILVNWTTTILGIMTWGIYVWIYTPLKYRSSWNTFVGAISGALPVLMGWTAVGGSLQDPRAFALFGILFLWQFPHFMAIAWIYRKQYEQAGMQMLPVRHPDGYLPGLQAIFAALVLIPVSLIPGMLPSLSFYVIPAFILGMMQLGCSWLFFLRRDDISARRLLKASLIYLPALFFLQLFIPFW